MNKECGCPCCQMRSGTAGLDPAQVKLCVDIWLGTLKHFRINRPVLPYENMKIAQLIKQYEHVDVMYALAGMRFEEKTQTFDPSKNIAIHRAFDAKLFEKFVNLAAKEKGKQ